MLKWLFGWGGSKRPLALDHFAFYDSFKDGNWVYNCHSGMVAFEKRVRAAFESMGFEVKELQKPWIRETVDPEII